MYKTAINIGRIEINHVFLFPLEVHAIFLTPGLLERGDVCDLRAAETGHDGSAS